MRIKMIEERKHIDDCNKEKYYIRGDINYYYGEKNI